MEIQVFSKCMLLLETSYPNFKITSDKTKLSVWYEMLGDRTEMDLMLGVKKYIATNEFPPTIAGINKAIASNQTSKAPDDLQAWAELQTSIRKWGMYHEDKAIESLSPETRAVVQALGFVNLCTSENQMADRAHFIKLYESRATKNKENATMGNKLSGLINQIANKTAMLTNEQPTRTDERPTGGNEIENEII